jgi:hypothetical protein
VRIGEVLLCPPDGLAELALYDLLEELESEVPLNRLLATGIRDGGEARRGSRAGVMNVAGVDRASP